MCYICRQDITVDQYNHFRKTKCEVYDQNTEKLHADDVAAAEKKALEKAKRENPDIPEEKLKVKMREGIEKKAPPTSRAAHLVDVMQAQADMHLAPNLHNPVVAPHRPPLVMNRLLRRFANAGMPENHPFDFAPPNFFDHARQPENAVPAAQLGGNNANPVVGQRPPPMPEGPRGRFPVMPFVPGRFGDMIHNPPLGPMWDGRGHQPQPWNAEQDGFHQGAAAADIRLGRAGNEGQAPQLDVPVRGRRDGELRRSATERLPRRR
jgi:hypothetical protein